MPEASTFLVFAAASLAFLVVPGPAVVFVATRSIEQGRAAGVVSAIGVQAGGLLHVAAAVLGLLALLASSAAAFSVVKYAGAAYLVYLGIQRWRPAGTAIFVLAFLPQFADPDRGAIAPQVAALGALFLIIATLSDGAYALVAGSIGERLRRSEGLRRRLDHLGGGVLIALGAEPRWAAIADASDQAAARTPISATGTSSQPERRSRAWWSL